MSRILILVLALGISVEGFRATHYLKSSDIWVTKPVPVAEPGHVRFAKYVSVLDLRVQNQVLFRQGEIVEYFVRMGPTLKENGTRFFALSDYQLFREFWSFKREIFIYILKTIYDDGVPCDIARSWLGYFQNS
jgi:hypothetical protein